MSQKSSMMRTAGAVGGLDLAEDFIVYVRFMETLNNPYAGHQTSVRVSSSYFAFLWSRTTMEYLKRTALTSFGYESGSGALDLNYILFCVRGRRVLDNTLTLGQLDVQPEETIIIQWS